MSIIATSSPSACPAASSAPAREQELHAAATRVLDALLARVATATAQLRLGAGPLQTSDREMARRLLADLGLVVSSWQAFGRLAAARLDAAQTELEDAMRQADRVLKGAGA